MYRKKFVPPLLKKPPTTQNTADDEPPQKKIKLEPQNNCQKSNSSDSGKSSQSNGVKRVLPAFRPPVGPGTKFNPPQLVRKPLIPVQNPPVRIAKDDGKATGEGSGGRYYFNVLWRKFQARKHKTWDGDGVLAIINGTATLQDTNGRDIASGRVSKTPAEGDVISLGGKEIEIDSLLPRSDFIAGKPFLKSSGKVEDVTATIGPSEFYAKSTFKPPLLAGTTVVKTHPQKAVPRFDPTAEGALVMKRPTIDSSLKNKTIVDVVVDPMLSRHLRPHQREGVAFLYETVMGMRPYEGRGAVLADEMGLGKTLQTIALLWTLLKQNPVHGQGPVVKKAMIVCPVTLINNWKREFKKWLGNERIHVFIADAKSNVRDFTHGPVYNVMIVGYERLRSIQDKLKQCQVDIIIADEGHRLKTAENKSAQAIRALATPRRVILSGTPLQNDLREFFVMVDFVNPGIFENYSTFKKQFENPIMKSQQPEASKADKELGNARKEELAKLTDLFVLRRTATILSKYLPPKTDVVLFCRPTKQQLELYQAILNTTIAKRQMGSMDTALQLITLLKKVCNSTALLKSKKDKEDGELSNSILEEARITSTALLANNSSGKLKVLEKLLVKLKETTKEKVVLVSNYTSTLDILEKMLNSRGFHHLRLDGKTPANKRQDLVDKFNRVNSDVAFAFLLSSKSGGAGLNLIGASRLILFDSDWNPATDLQAMARVHRDGQKSHVYIYRMITTGCIDEKIYQRQITKQGLADSIMDQKAGGSNFTTAELRDLFRLDAETVCNTHDLLCCECGGTGDIADEIDEGEEEEKEEEEEEPMRIAGWTKASMVDMDKQEDDYMKATSKAKQRMRALLEFSHIDPQKLMKEDEDTTKDEDDVENEEPMAAIEDAILRTVVEESPKSVSFIFTKNSL
ncbi:helicase [Orbilia ellipsospora]|uniref:Helicase n=1 Tax=Orbilia ellipsospora TaxID=2528407 RepID=A0AAV9XD72_9PEZI